MINQTLTEADTKMKKTVEDSFGFVQAQPEPEREPEPQVLTEFAAVDVLQPAAPVPAKFQQGFFEWRFAGHDRLVMPVLVIAGELDYQIGLGPQRALAAALPRGQLLIYEGAGHFMYVDQPDRFARDVSAFFRGERVE